MDSLPSSDSFREDVSDLELEDTSELVLLAVCANQEPLDSDWVSSLNIRDFVRDCNGDVDTSTELNALREGGYVDRSNGGEYQLTAKGMERCLSVLEYGQTESGVLAFTDPDIRQDLYRHHVEHHDAYLDLIDEINSAYRLGHNTSVAVLVRRLFEDISWQFSTKLYDDVSLFLTDDGNPLNFGPIVTKLKDNPDGLRGISPELSNSDEITAFLEDIDELRVMGNDSAHGVQTNLPREELQEKSEMTTRCIEISYTLLRSANGSS